MIEQGIAMGLIPTFSGVGERAAVAKDHLHEHADLPEEP
jgi:hypothetical protein